MDLQVKKVEEYSEVTLNDLFKFGPDERDVIKDFAECAVLVTGCSGSGASSLYIGPLGGYLAARAVCGYAAFSCVSAYLSYTEWKNAKTEERKKEGESNRPTASHGGEGPGAVMPTGRPTGIPIRLAEKCQTVIGSVTAGGVTTSKPMKVCKNVVQ